MAYVVVVFCIINTLALVATGLILAYIKLDMPTMVETAIQDEVRKQDDRIEKRLARAAGPVGEVDVTNSDGAMRVGQPFRR